MTAGLETFAKVRALHDRTTSPGEKTAAASRMEALARSTGMTVAEAVSKLDRPKPKPKAAPKSQAQATADAFNAFFNTPPRAERHAAIRALLAAGHTDREVARRLGISPTTVGAIRKGQP